MPSAVLLIFILIITKTNGLAAMRSVKIAGENNSICITTAVAAPTHGRDQRQIAPGGQNEEGEDKEVSGKVRYWDTNV